MNHVHGDIPHPKYSQVFGGVERNQVTNHELIPKYQVQKFGHMGTLSWSYQSFFSNMMLWNFIQNKFFKISMAFFCYVLMLFFNHMFIYWIINWRHGISMFWLWYPNLYHSYLYKNSLLSGLCGPFYFISSLIPHLYVWSVALTPLRNEICN